MRDLFSRSVAHLVGLNAGLAPVAPALCRIPEMLEAREPYDAVAALSASLFASDPATGGPHRLFVRLLAFRGYGVEGSLYIWRHVLRGTPQPHTLRLMNAAAITDLLGATYSQPVVDALTAPAGQPILAALLDAGPDNTEPLTVDRHLAELHVVLDVVLDESGPTPVWKGDARWNTLRDIVPISRQGAQYRLAHLLDSSPLPARVVVTPPSTTKEPI